MTAIQALKEKVAALADKLGLTAETVTVEPVASEQAPAPEAVATPEAVTEPVATVEGDVDHGAEVKTDEAPSAEGEKVAEVVAEVDPLAELAEKFEALDAKFTEALANASTEMRAELEKEFDERVAKAAAQKLASATAQPLPVTPGEANENGEISKPKLKGAAAVAAALKARRGA
jgi:hypothetical protein